jgi:hypothetical protein
VLQYCSAAVKECCTLNSGTAAPFLGVGGNVDQTREFRFVAEKAYSIPGRGVVVTGRVEKGLVSVGDEIGFLGMEGRYVAALVIAIEVSRRLVEVAEAGQEASLLLQGIKKEQVTTGTILTALPEAAPAPVTPSPSERIPSQITAPPSTPSPYEARPIHPSSSFWRTAFYVVIGIVILLLLLYAQGRWDPKKWDPRRKLAAIELSERRDGAPSLSTANQRINKPTKNCFSRSV